jgi:hypothetical protein
MKLKQKPDKHRTELKKFGLIVAEKRRQASFSNYTLSISLLIPKRKVADK